MDYEKKYKEALKRAEKALEVLGTDKCEGARQIFSLFPELKESEDERIRKGLVKAVSGALEGTKLFGTDITRDEALAWLEKQDKQKVPVVDFKAKDWYLSKVDGKIHNIYNSVDRIEPKFKIGDIIINIHYKWDGKHRIREITDGKYIFDGGSYINIKEQDSWELANKVEPKFKVYVLVI